MDYNRNEQRNVFLWGHFLKGQYLFSCQSELWQGPNDIRTMPRLTALFCLHVIHILPCPTYPGAYLKATWTPLSYLLPPPPIAAVSVCEKNLALNHSFKSCTSHFKVTPFSLLHFHPRKRFWLSIQTLLLSLYTFIKSPHSLGYSSENDSSMSNLDL